MILKFAKMRTIFSIPHSTFKLLIGLVNAALIAWKLTTAIVISSEPAPAARKIHQLSAAR
jgi:hypothetical protein